MPYVMSLASRVEMLETVLEGTSPDRVARGLGVHPQTVWRSLALMGVRVKPGRVAPGGSPVRFREGWESFHGAETGHGKRLSLADRLLIQLGREQGLNQSQIAETIGCHRSTVSRELHAHEVEHQGRIHPRPRQYSAKLAQYRASQARARPKPRALDLNPQLKAAVIERLNKGYSPAQIAVRLPLDFPHDESMRITGESIYQALYVQGRGALRHELSVEKALRSGRTSRKPASKLPARTNRPWLAGCRLADRSQKLADEHAGRAVAGHWEGDLVVGPHNSGVITLVERTSRYMLIGRLPGLRDSATVIDRLTEMISGLPLSLRRSLTWDQGSEMAQHPRFSVATNCPVYFCDPHSPWQRPSNENHNGQLRWDFPKGTNFNTITDQQLHQVQDKLNTRPRVILKGYTPAEILDTVIRNQQTTVALTT